VVLAGFSTALYALASNHLHGQAEERLDAALNTLTAAVDVAPECLEWERGERHLQFSNATGGDELVWVVGDADGGVVDRSTAADANDFLAETGDHLRANPGAAQRVDWKGGRWLFRQQWLHAGHPGTPAQQQQDRAEKKYPALSITVGVSLEPVQATLRQLAMVLVGLSLGVWLAAFVAGRFVCRRALSPVTRMAGAARAMDGTDLDRRLPTTASGDELEDFGRAFNSLLERLQESFERQRRFTGDASHQLRTPLAAILGQIQVALRRQRPAEDYREVLATVQGQAERLRQIVEALLFVARADAEAQLPDRERVNLRDWLPAHVRSWADHPRAGDLIVDSADTEAAWVDVHPILLGELVNVLLDNACKYSAPGKPITLRLVPSAGAVELAVQDEGCGISDEDVPHLFRPFFRSTEVRRRGIEGLGLGLAVAKRVADGLGGTLTVASRVGQGSCFTLRLAASPVPQPPFAAISPAGKFFAPTPSVSEGGPRE
jgi:signal transduction histidine kinase